MLPIPNSFYISRKTQKQLKFTAVSLKTGSHFLFLIYFCFTQKNPNKSLYADVPEMFKFNLKISIRKYPIICSWYNFFSSNVSDLYTHFMIENQKLRALIFLQKIKLCYHFVIIKPTCFEKLYNMLKD